MVIHRLRQAGRRPVRLVLIAIALLAITSAAASAGAPSPSAAIGSANKVTLSASVSAPDAAAFKAYLACTTEHGIDMPDPTTTTITTQAPDTAGDGTVTNSGTGVLNAGPDLGSLTIVAGPVSAGSGDPATGPDAQKFQAADAACRHLLPPPSTQPATAVGAGLPAAFADYAACMTKNGIDMPAPQDGISGQAPTLVEVGSATSGDPTLSQGDLKPVEGVVIAGVSGVSIAPNSDAFNAADAACRHLLPEGAVVNMATVAAPPADATSKP